MIRNIVFILMLSFSCLYATASEQMGINNPENFVRKIPKELTSKSGIKFWFLRDESSKLVHVKIAFTNCGAPHLQKSKAGTAALYAQSVFCGAGKYSKQEFEKECHDNSISISSLADFDNIKFSLTTSEIVLQEAAQLLNAVLVTPKFEEKEVLKIQNSLDIEAVTLQTLLPAKIFKSHVYERGTVGDPEEYAKLTIGDLKEYKKHFIVKKNAKVLVCGAVTEQQAITLIDKIFSGMSEGKKAEDSVQNVSPQLSSEIEKYYLEGPQSKIVFAFKNKPCLSDKRREAMILYGLLGSISFMQNKILAKLRTEKGLIYMGYIYPSDMKHANVMYGILLTDNAKTEAAVSSLKTIIKELKEKGITQREFELIKNNMLGTALVGLRTSAALSEFYFRNMLKGFSVDVLRKIISEINNAKLADVNEIAKELLDENCLSVNIIGGNA